MSIGKGANAQANGFYLSLAFSPLCEYPRFSNQVFTAKVTASKITHTQAIFLSVQKNDNRNRALNHTKWPLYTEGKPPSFLIEHYSGGGG